MNGYENLLTNLVATTGVLASEDILSDQGAVVAKSGTKINKKLWERVVSFKLIKPLEQSICLEDQLVAKSLYADIITLCKKEKQFRLLQEVCGDIKVLQKCCLKANQFPLLMQKLTVMKMQQVEVYQQSLITAHIMYLIALEQNRADTEVFEFFLAGLFHDLGMLHVDLCNLDRRRDLNPEEVRQLFSHSLVSFEILSRVKGISESVALAARDHNEMIDGSGFPKGKMRGSLSTLAQILSFVVEIVEIYFVSAAAGVVKTPWVLPVISVLQQTYAREGVNAFYSMVRKLPPPEVALPSHDQIIDNVQYICALESYLSEVVASIERANEAVGLDHADRLVHAVQNRGISIMLGAYSVGVGDLEQLWGGLATEPESVTLETYLELQDAIAVAEEITRQVAKFRKKLVGYTSANPNSEATSPFLQIMNDFSTLARPVRP